MALHHELEASGNWLFRRRGILPLLLLPIVVVAVLSHPTSAATERAELRWELACLLVGLVGFAIRVATVAYAAPGTSGRNRAGQRADTLNTSGMYSVVRHPLYLGNYLMWLGVAAVPRVWWLPLLVTLAFWLYYERIMYAEESFLRARFAATFDQWAAVTPAMLPRLSAWRPPEQPFSLRAVLRREYSSVLVLIGCFALLDVLGALAARRPIGPTRFWLILFALTAIVSAGLRLLRHRTSLLRARGR